MTLLAAASITSTVPAIAIPKVDIGFQPDRNTASRQECRNNKARQNQAKNQAKDRPDDDCFHWLSPQRKDQFHG